MNPRAFNRRSFLLLGRGSASDGSREPAEVAPPGQAFDPQPGARRTQLRPLAPLSTRPSADPAPESLDAPGAAGLAVALVDSALCTAWRGLPCRICREVCPVTDAIVLERRDRGWVPVAGPAACTGCGACRQHCPAEGAIRMVAAEEGGDHRVRVLTPGIHGA